MFIPKRIIFEKGALEYPIGKEIYSHFVRNQQIEIIELKGNRIKETLPGESPAELYREGKNTLVVGVKKGLKYQTCKPSAHYQLPLVSGCIGHCQYCYLNTNLGDKPYTKISVNVDELLDQAGEYIRERLPELTLFEGSATSDPVPVEPYSRLLQSAIEYFGKSPNGRFRFVTKYTDVDTLLNLSHNNHTEIRFTLNTEKVIREYENRTPSSDKRIEASRKVLEAGYPSGFLIAPVFLYENWKEDYRDLLERLEASLPQNLIHPITFEIITHRYTTRAKNVITELFPDHSLPMKDEDRSYKYGQFGYGKYVYPKEQLAEVTAFFKQELEEHYKNRQFQLNYVI